LNIAIGYYWYNAAAGYHFERGFRSLGHHVVYVGLGSAARPGYAETTPIDAIVAELSPAPDLFLWIDSAARYFPVGIESLSIPTACYLIDVHLGHWREEVAHFFDMVFIAQNSFLDHYRDLVGHHQIHWLPLAAADDVHVDHHLTRCYEVGFVGNVAQAHRKTPRSRRLQLLTSHFKTNDFYRSYSPEEVGRIYSESQVVFNTSIAGDVTMRIFEGSATGALVLTDSTANGLPELFKLGAEIVTYTDDDDLLEKVHYYLAHADEREMIARAGQQRTLSQHTYRHRCQKILDCVTSPTFVQAAPMRTAKEAVIAQARRRVYTHLHMLDALFDQERRAGTPALLRLWRALPCLVRRAVI
jgi:hypothetical protein